jgi:hypothetical protein
MALVQPVNTAQIQQKIDDFARAFIALESQAQDLVAFNSNLTQANVTAGLLKGDDGLPMTIATLTEMQSRLGALQNFLNYANGGGANSPLNYLHGIKRAV